MLITEPYFASDALPPTKEETSFLVSFIRLATEDGKKDMSEVDHYIDITKTIPNMQNLNTQVLWAAFQALSRLDDKTRDNLSKRPREVHNLFQERGVITLVDKLSAVKQDAKYTESYAANLRQNMETQLYRYIRLILDSPISL